MRLLSALLIILSFLGLTYSDSFSFSAFSLSSVLAFTMSYHLRDRIPRDYAAMRAGQHVDDDQDEFHDSFQYQPPPAPVLPSTSQVQPSSTPFSGTQTNTSAPNEDVAALTAEIARVRAENEALERETEVARLKAELVTLQQRNAQLQKQKQPQRSSNPTIKTLRANPALTARVSEELKRLGFSSSGSGEEENPPTRGSRGKPRLMSGKTTKLTSRVVFPQLWPHSQLSLAYVSKDNIHFHTFHTFSYVFRRNRSQRSKVIYKPCCWDCNDFYIHW